MKGINVSDETKARFDKIQVQVSIKLGRNATQDETQRELLGLWEEQEAQVIPWGISAWSVLWLSSRWQASASAETARSGCGTRAPYARK